jgi:hypothetical protein
LSHNIRPEVGSGPGGLETYTTVKNSEPQRDRAEPEPQPIRPEERQAAERSQPKHPDEHQAPEPTPGERLAAELKELDAAPDERQVAREITARQDADASSKRQDIERRAEAGELRSEDAAAAPSREQTAGERLAAELKELDVEPTPQDQDAGREAPSFGRGMI